MIRCLKNLSKNYYLKFPIPEVLTEPPIAYYVRKAIAVLQENGRENGKGIIYKLDTLLFYDVTAKKVERFRLF